MAHPILVMLAATSVAVSGAGVKETRSAVSLPTAKLAAAHSVKELPASCMVARKGAKKNSLCAANGRFFAVHSVNGYDGGGSGGGSGGSNLGAYIGAAGGALVGGVIGSQIGSDKNTNLTIKTVSGS